METFLRCLFAYFAPDIASERWQLLWNVCNLLCGAGATAIVYALITRWKPGKPTAGSRVQNLKKQILPICLSVFALYIMGLGSEFLRNPDPTFPLYHSLYSLVDFIDRFVDLRNLYMFPIERLPLANMGIRAVWIVLLFRLSCGIFGVARELSEIFGDFLDQKLNAARTKVFGGKIWGFLKRFGLVGSAVAGTAVVVTNDNYRDKVTEILGWLYEALSQITFLAHLPERAATFSEMAYAFFVVVLSILIVAIYLLLIVAVSAVAHVLWEKREKVLQAIKKWFLEIGYILLIVVLVLFVVLFSVLFATKSASFQDAIIQFIQNSPQTIFVLLQHTAMLLAAVGIVVLMCITLIAVVMFGINFLKAWGENVLVNKPDKDSATLFLKRFASVFLAGLAVLVLVLGYDPIRGWLIDRFADDSSGYGFWWVVTTLCSGIAVAVAVIGAALLGFYLILYLTSLFWRAVRSLDWSKAAVIVSKKQRVSLSKQIKEYVHSLGENIFRIFKGYQTEDQKNGAIYVAACFASLASLINTALGLHDFNINWFLSIAMSFAIQLAMLIFGMKAGQGIAENMVSDVKQVGANFLLAIVRKLAACFCYILAFFAVKYGVSILAGETVLGLSATLLSQKETFLPTLLIWGAALAFGYGIVQQLLEVGILTYRLIKNCKSTSRTPTSGGQDGNNGPVLNNPRRVPARYPLLAYLLLMLVSTGFAFTNLFGGYANQVQLHTRVYDQVYSETEKKLELQDTAAKVVDSFLKSKQTVLEELRTSYNALAAKHEQNTTLLETADELEGTQASQYWYARNALSAYSNNTEGFAAFYQSLSSFINQEYDLLGESMTILVRQYSYEEYQNVEIEIQSAEFTEPLKIGSIPTDSKQEHITERPIEGANKYVLLRELFAVYETFSKTISECTILQYSHITYTSNDLLTMYFDNPSQYSCSIDGNLATISDGLEQMERLDGVRRNVAELYFAVNSNAEQCVAMLDLPRIIDLYLTQERSEPAKAPVPAETTAPAETTVPVETTVPTAATAPVETTMPANVSEGTTIPTEFEDPKKAEIAEQKYDKLVTYQALSDYVDRAIQIHNILSVAERVADSEPTSSTPTETTVPAGTTVPTETTEPAGPAETTVPTETTEPEEITETAVPTEATDPMDPAKSHGADKVYTVRKYRSYARGVASSNLQISFDTLLCGSMGLNDTGSEKNADGEMSHNINALYSAQMIAKFILIICALVDFMAFFSGLLLFQDVFVLDMKKNSKLSKLGYINFDAVLSKYFMPTENDGSYRKLQIALIYYLLYCKNGNKNDADLLSRLNVDPDKLKDMLPRVHHFLDQYGVSITEAEFHGWLDSFAKKNGIDFDEVLK